MSIFYRANLASSLPHLLVLTGLSIILAANCAAAPERPDRSGPPAIAREFRGVWVATVGNIDWPSRPGLSSDKQKQELIAIFDKCVALNLNAVIFQVRTEADALYASKLEPWSEFLSGRMGEPPKPYYDPLEFAVEEAHRRGLQLHAWFNPYRVRMPGAKGAAADNHVTVAHPEIVRKYGKYLWFDPGERAAEESFIAVLNDVVNRYDIDGVHIDDYFYPYQERDKAGKIIPFPDDATYKRATAAGVKLKRDDWRRQNVNHLIQRMYEEVKKAKPWVLVGISPFGIWRPDNPPGVVGLDQYGTLYADARKWQQEGWLDYITPQLYWQVESKGQPYAKLLSWWAEQNAKNRHLWPGNSASTVRRKSDTPESKSAWSAEELIRQIEATRSTPGATGNVHFSMKAFLKDYDGIDEKLKNGLYAEPALVPESPWLGRETPRKPVFAVKQSEEGVGLQLRMPIGKPPWQYLVRVQTADGWKTSIAPGNEPQYLVRLPAGAKAKSIAVSAVSRLGREGKPTVLKLTPQE